MNSALILVLGLLIAAIVMFAINKPRMDAVALIVLVLLPFTGVVSMSEALVGFSDANIVLIAALFVIGDGLVRTGVARRLGDWLSLKAGSNDILLLVLLMVVVCGLGSMMSSTAVTAIFIPVALRIAQSTGTSPGRLMMPISFAALISGMTTLVATAPNLVVNSELIRNDHAGFQFFSFTPFGVPILILGIVYMIFARHWLPSRTTEAAARSRPSLANFIDDYQLAGSEYRVRIPESSPILGKTLEELNLRKSAGATVLAIERTRHLRRDVVLATAKTVFEAGDVLFIDLFAPAAQIESFVRTYGLETLPLTGEYFSDRSQELGMAEVIVHAGSKLIGHTVVDAKVFTRIGLRVIGLRRGRNAVDRGAIQDEKLKLGDTLLVVGRWKHIERLDPDDSGVVVMRLPAEINEVLPAPNRAIQAVVCLLLVVGLMISGVIPNVQAALIGCLLMGAMGCVTLTSAYRAIDWKTIVLIVGMLPFSTALQRTGGVELMANGLMSVVGAASPHIILAAVFAITAMLGLFISNTATAVLMAPVALAIARDLNYSPYPFAMIVALAASTAFMTPVSSPVNTLVVGPGNYTFGDFVKIGTPFSILAMIVCVTLVPWILPLTP